MEQFPLFEFSVESDTDSTGLVTVRKMTSRNHSALWQEIELRIHPSQNRTWLYEQDSCEEGKAEDYKEKEEEKEELQ